MRATGIFFVYLTICLCLGAATTYPIVATGWFDYDPHRIMGRLAQIYILIGIWPLLALLGLDNRRALGFGIERTAFLRALVGGWLLGLAMLALLVVALLVLGVRVVDPPGADWPLWLARKALQALFAGLMIGLIEEAFFRGALFAAIRRRGSPTAAILWSAGLYALVHFMKPHPIGDIASFEWIDAWRMFVNVFVGAFEWHHLDSFIALFSAGVLLGLVRHSTGHIGWCIGLHAGWVFVIQVARRLTDTDDASRLAYLVGDYDGTIGWLAAVWIIAIALVLIAVRRRTIG